MICLEYQDLHNRIFQHVFYQPKISIGRAPQCDLCVLETSVSKTHASIFVLNGKTFIVDLNSTNGVLLNGVQVQRAEILFGDFVQLGDFAFRYVEAREEGEFSQQQGNKKIILQ